MKIEKNIRKSRWNWKKNIRKFLGKIRNLWKIVKIKEIIQNRLRHKGK